jgi:hypothetical protein
MTNRNRSGKRGVAVIEFTFSLVVLIPMLLGALVFGFRLIHSLEMEQVVRDIGHMYIKNVDFRLPGPIANAKTLAATFNLNTNGTSVLILSKIRVVTQADCDANNVTAGIHCTNLGNPVFVEQLKIGNTSLQAAGVSISSSVFGTPPTQANFTVLAADQANNAAASAGNAAGGTGFAALMGILPGEFAYLVEMRNATPDLNIPGFSGSPQVYARSIF